MEFFRITAGLNVIPFDALVTAHADTRYTLAQSPSGMDEPMTEDEVRSALSRLPVKIRGQALKRGLSRITFPFTIKGSSDADMEDARHDLTEILEDGKLYIATQGARGTRAVLMVKANNVPAGHESHKTIFYGEAMEMGGRAVLGGAIKQSFLLNLQMVLYCEPLWRPYTRADKTTVFTTTTAIPLGPNELACPGFEEDGNADGLADNWNLTASAPAAAMDCIDHALLTGYVLQGFFCQKLLTAAANSQGIESDVFTDNVGYTSAVAYVWITRTSPGDDIAVELYDATATAVRATALYDTAGWPTVTGKGGHIWKRVSVSSAALLGGVRNYQLRIQRRAGDATQATDFWVDKCFWKWGTTVIPDEWCDHWRLFNHYDTTEGAAHEGHQNYFDVADLKGTDEARTMIRAGIFVVADEPRYADLIVGRSSRFDYAGDLGAAAGNCRDIHWLEAEDGVYVSNWAAFGGAGLARCSAGDCVDNDNVDANTTGYRGWNFDIGAVGVENYADQVRGRWYAFGVVWTDDIVNTQYQLSYTSPFGITRYYNPWVKQMTASTWQLTYLGTVDFGQYHRVDAVAGDYNIYVEYAKEAAATVRLDCLWLVRCDEPIMRLHIPDGEYLSNTDWVAQRIEDFDSANIESNARTPLPNTFGQAQLRGDMISLSPSIDQRLYFCCESQAVPLPYVRSYEAHGAATDLQFIVWVDYVPQYRSPLD